MADQSPFEDKVSPILSGDPALSDEQRADLFDVFHGSKDPTELVEKLRPMDDVPVDTKQALLNTKKSMIPPVAPLDKTTAALQKFKELDPEVLELAESHPNVLKVLAAAATTPEKGPTEGAGTTFAKSKGDGAGSGKKPAPLQQPPRPDGLQHLPPIDPSHYRILSSDGGLHDVPKENVEKARALDPNMHVLNP